MERSGSLDLLELTSNIQFKYVGYLHCDSSPTMNVLCNREQGHKHKPVGITMQILLRCYLGGNIN